MSWIEEEPDPKPLGTFDWARAIARGVIWGLVLLTGLVALLVLRLIERPIHGLARPWTPWITQMVCRMSLPILGMGYRVSGRPMNKIGAVVANHGSWLDIFALNACQRVYFVSKAEVARWPFVGWLARATGTVFIKRDPREAKAQQALFEERIRAGHHLLFFPEGTSTDARRVLPFKPTLFQAFYSHGLDKVMQIQPVTVVYRPPEGEDPRFYGWWGDMEFGPHLLKVLAQRRQGSVEIVFHTPLSVADYPSRKELAWAAEAAVRAGLPYEIARSR
ncbi:1-acyl-sn-glycerol-3-phosphate acyltransferase [Thioclava sp. L04-15]|uniref:lysophospholipid acyltransferase family protein n=1 Tax=Thioclava sp. L04-15 TaxID=1915318 RepID=UPI000997CE09|nr:lysophospholipid acyltransferase family protein [Thioclava sp. L04-15]OOY28271.1 1-acyl-sn-glycerol-3-phosphate acyltransferase [Thioclava sp. L04-15]TNE88838.1 MAG: 1-acyl-sn-glycerol-3-phosphate acyltransferase [Paracoccaceae bacterium]